MLLWIVPRVESASLSSAGARIYPYWMIICVVSGAKGIEWDGLVRTEVACQWDAGRIVWSEMVTGAGAASEVGGGTAMVRC